MFADKTATLVARAAALVAQQQPAAAQRALWGLPGSAAALMRARVALQQEDWLASDVALGQINDARLQPLVQLERGRLYLAQGLPRQAQGFLMPLVQYGGPQAQEAALPLARALLAADANGLIAVAPRLMQLFAPSGAEPADDAHGQDRSDLMQLVAQAHEAVGDMGGAQALWLQRYLTEPHARGAQAEAPKGAQIHAAAALGRIELLVAAHRSTAARAALQAFDAQYPAAQLTADVACRKCFASGLTHRKLHRYSEAERDMAFVRARCGHDEALSRRAAFVEAKVVNIQDGMRALPLIEAFAKLNPNHSMTDDVLFWAADSHQRRGHIEAAEAYYQRILDLPKADDQCEEAAWRLAWIAYTSQRMPLARARLAASLKGRCDTSADGIARAHYWLGRLDEDSGAKDAAAASYRRSMAARTMGYYGQLAAQRILRVLPVSQRRVEQQKLSPEPATIGGLCPLKLVDEPQFVFGVALLRMGLVADAAAALARVPLPDVAQAPGGRAVLSRCGPEQSALLLIALRFSAQDPKGALQQLLQRFSGTLAGPAVKGSGAVWRAAYPQALRPLLQAAEAEQRLPPWLLQALAREESRFDAQAVSWAEAYGLTQLTVAAANTAAGKLMPKAAAQDMHTLMDAALNARLGGALLSHLGQRYQGFWPLALAAYNGGQRVGDAWWQRHQGDDFARMVEEIPVRETRTYVQRVMESFGIYRWLYMSAAPGDMLPDRVLRKKAPQVPTAPQRTVK